jgi:hypothetical protein
MQDVFDEWYNYQDFVGRQAGNLINGLIWLTAIIDQL